MPSTPPIFPRRTRVKFCGITSREDAEAAVAAGADALGFNGWTGSKRHVDLRASGSWIAALPPFVSRVAVLVNAPLEEARAVSALPFIDAVQFHGDEDADYCRRFAETGAPFLKAVRVADARALDEIDAFATRAILLDASVPGVYGGSGALIDLSVAAQLIGARPDLHIALSGGLTPENVEAAIRMTRPFGVDVASGIESKPAKKDVEKMRRFASAAARA